MDDTNKFLVIISAKLLGDEEEKLMEVFKEHHKAFGHSMDDLKGISPMIAIHRIFMEEGAEPVAEFNRRLSPEMKEVVRKEIVCLLDVDIIYPVKESEWVCPVHCVPKKGSCTVVPNENNELIPTRTIVGHRMCIDFRKLNKETRKYHYPLPFIDQTLDRLANHTHFCYLDGYSDFSQIVVHPADQVKTTLISTFGLHAYQRMTFHLCNAPATFQRCMTAIFADFIELIMEVFMDDFSVYGISFTSCFNSLKKVL